MHKLTELCEVMDVHPLTLLTLAYAGDSTRKADQLLVQVRQEQAVLKERDTRHRRVRDVLRQQHCAPPRWTGRWRPSGRLGLAARPDQVVRAVLAFD